MADTYFHVTSPKSRPDYLGAAHSTACLVSATQSGLQWWMPRWRGVRVYICRALPPFHLVPAIQSSKTEVAEVPAEFGRWGEV